MVGVWKHGSDDYTELSLFREFNTELNILNDWHLTEKNHGKKQEKYPIKAIKLESIHFSRDTFNFCTVLSYNDESHGLDKVAFSHYVVALRHFHLRAYWYVFRGTNICINLPKHKCTQKWRGVEKSGKERKERWNSEEKGRREKWNLLPFMLSLEIGGCFLWNLWN